MPALRVLAAATHAVMPYARSVQKRALHYYLLSSHHLFPLLSTSHTLFQCPLNILTVSCTQKDTKEKLNKNNMCHLVLWGLFLMVYVTEGGSLVVVVTTHACTCVGGSSNCSTQLTPVHVYVGGGCSPHLSLRYFSCVACWG